MTKRSIWFSLHSSLWLIPLLLLIISTVLAVIFIQLDLIYGEHLKDFWPDFFRPSADGASQIMSAIAGSMMTVAGVVFSVTIVALSLSANQYSPRALREFMRNRLNQFILGIFFGVFLYSILVLQAIGSRDPEFVPQLAVWMGVGFTVVAIIFLIIFIHQTAVSIQVVEVISQIAKETIATFDNIRQTCEKDSVQKTPEMNVQKWTPIVSNESGFIQDIDVENLYQLACRHDLVLRVESSIGAFVGAGRVLVSVGDAQVNDEIIKHVRRSFGINTYRTIEQDPEFGIRQIVDIAAKALASGASDTSTAINCIDYLGVILHQGLQIEPLPSVQVEGSQVRLLLKPPTREHLIDVALNEVRQCARGNVAAILRLLQVLRHLLEAIPTPELRAHLLMHVRLLGEEAESSIPVERDMKVFRSAYERTLALNTQSI